MKLTFRNMSIVAYARVTGLLYLIIIVLGLSSELLIRSKLIVAGDPALTASNITAAEGLFRTGFAFDLIIFLCDVAVAVLLYVMLRSVSRTGSLLAAGFRLTGTAIYGVNLLNYMAAIILLSGAEYLESFTPDQVNSLSFVFLHIHRYGYDLGLVFFGLHCGVLGYLIYNSDHFPRILGVLMVLACAGYVVGSFTLFLFPDHARAVAPVYIAPFVGELSLCLWLLIKGVKRSVVTG